MRMTLREEAQVAKLNMELYIWWNLEDPVKSLCVLFYPVLMNLLESAIALVHFFCGLRTRFTILGKLV